jgi:hypothetical protein
MEAAALARVLARLRLLRAGWANQQRREGCTASADAPSREDALRVTMDMSAAIREAQAADVATRRVWHIWIQAAADEAAVIEETFDSFDAAKQLIEGVIGSFQRNQEEGEEVLVAGDGLGVEVRGGEGMMKVWVGEGGV